MGDARKTPLQERRCHQSRHHHHNQDRGEDRFIENASAIDHERQADARKDEPHFAAKQTYDRGTIN